MSAQIHEVPLGGRYRLVSRIAVGGMGEVWRAEDQLLQRPVAVKILKPELTGDPAFLERFRTEARTTASLSHPGIASVHDYGEGPLPAAGEPRMAYLVMELVPGEPLSAILARQRRPGVEWTLGVVEQAAAALEAAHRAGLVHRDVKPGNLLVTADGAVKITDFGIARVADAVPLTRNGTVVGTAQYFSPEQAAGDPVTPASDVYALGVVAYECLAGRLPFLADSPITVALMQIRNSPPPLPADVPAAVHRLVAQAMAKDPRYRFASGGPFAAAVRSVRAGMHRPAAVPPVAVSPVAGYPGGAALPAAPVTSPGARREQRRLVLLVITGLVAVILVAVTIALAVHAGLRRYRPASAPAWSGGSSADPPARIVRLPLPPAPATPGIRPEPPGTRPVDLSLPRLDHTGLVGAAPTGAAQIRGVTPPTGPRRSRTR